MLSKTNIPQSKSVLEMNFQKMFDSFIEKLVTMTTKYNTSGESSNKTEKKPVKADLNTKKNFASVLTPLHRILETQIVLFHISFVFLSTAASLYIFANPLLLCTVFLPYFIWYFSDRTPANGKVFDRFAFRCFRNLTIWKWYCKFFPIQIHKTCDLKPTYPTSSSSSEKELGPNYIFGYHPHGICAMGAFGGISTNGCGFDQIFPGIKVSLLTLINNFQIPFYREYLMSAGLSSVSKKNCLKLLNNKKSVCIVIGGAAEALLAGCDKADIILLKRKGFVKIALEIGNIGLVPVFAFGENDIYQVLTVEDNSIFKKAQLWTKKKIGFTVPIFFARGVFNYDWGFLPFRKPINLVFGKPIYVPKIENFTAKDLNHYHSLYVQELTKIFEEHKCQFGYKDLNINFIE